MAVHHSVDDIEITRREVGSQIVFTSTDVKALFVALHPEEEHRSRESIQSALDMLHRMETRIEARKSGSETAIEDEPGAFRP